MRQKKPLKKYKSVFEKGFILLSFYDDEIVKNLEINGLIKNVKVIENPGSYLDLIEEKFEFNGSQIDWLKTKNHFSIESNNESLLTDASLFISELKEKYLNNSVEIMYIGDGLTEFGYQFESKDIEQILVYLLEVPQHHYFIPLDGDWCFCVSFENYLDFGFSFNRN